MLDREEYIEQAYFFHVLGERMERNLATQDLLSAVREEILATTKLPMALDFLASELRLTGTFAPAMSRLSHYFTAFQTFVVAEAERERGRFDFLIALQVLEREARYRAEGATPPGLFVYQFEAVCRNRLGYDRGLEAMAADTMYDESWREWILAVRRQVGFVDFADLVYLRSAHYAQQRARQGDGPPQKPVLFGEKEGRIALANRRKDPLYLFAALQRQLNYPSVPRPKPVDESRWVIPNLIRRVERLESRLKLLEEEAKGGLDLTKFYGQAAPAPDDLAGE